MFIDPDLKWDFYHSKRGSVEIRSPAQPPRDSTAEGRGPKLTAAEIAGLVLPVAILLAAITLVGYVVYGLLVAAYQAGKGPAASALSGLAPWAIGLTVGAGVAAAGIAFSSLKRALPRSYAFAEACFAFALGASVFAPGATPVLDFQATATLLGAIYVMVRATDNWAKGVASHGWPRFIPGIARKVVPTEAAKAHGHGADGEA